MSSLDMKQLVCDAASLLKDDVADVLCSSVL